MKSIPLVSVIMPVYNGEKYLRPAIESILGQTFRDYEFILINDGSKDKTQEIIESYSDPRIVAVKQENMGVARSLNKGLAMARGKYLRRHDADDVSLPGHLQSQVDFMESHPEFSLVSDQIAYMTDRGRKAPRYRNPRNDFFAG
ncbi:MAG: glycosyltransferase family 2 protein, partial [Bacteroidetes bacterium]|nr:glycosyltransferase family 2 protein [Bacteroidota bacterium]